MVERWNSVVKPGDRVYHLGDVFMGSQETFPKLWARLNGRKRLIVGNHDDIPYLSNGKFFDKVEMWYRFEDFGFLATHVPVHHGSLKRFDGNPEWYNLHGHIHEKTVGDDSYVNVSVEVINYTPVNLETLRDSLAL